MLQHLRPALVSLALLTLLTGALYPLVVTGIAKMAFSSQAEGSLIVKDGKVLGSHRVGQAFSDPKFFWSRASATSPYPYNASASSGSNQGPTNPALVEAVSARIKALKDADPANPLPIPVDLVTASGSGLDPHISIAAADYQVDRVARTRGVAPAKVRELVANQTEGRWMGLLGEPRVNVLQVNLALEGLRK